MIEIEVGKKITIRNMPLALRNHVKKSLRVENPGYQRLIRMGVSRFAAQQYYRYYSEDKKKPDELVIPRGFRLRLISFLEKINEEYRSFEALKEYEITGKLKHLIELRDYQVPIVEDTLQHNEGIVKLSTGGGKTAVATELIYRTNMVTTILVPNTVLLNHFKDEILRFTGYKVGIVGEGKKEVKDITVATFQSLSADAELLWRLVQRTSLLIVDECQGAISKERLKVLQSFAPKRLYGLSATPRRSKDDGRTDAVGFHFGAVVAEHQVEDLKPTIDVWKTGIEYDYDDYHRMIDYMVSHETRNKMIAGAAMIDFLNERKVLIITKRREHYKKIYEFFKDSEFAELFVIIDSEDPNRNQLLKDLKSGKRKFGILLGTSSLLGVGTDIPQLDTLVIACDVKSDVLTHQMVGRTMRLFSGKQQPKVVDFYDEKCQMFMTQFRQRCTVYTMNGWPINY